MTMTARGLAGVVLAALEADAVALGRDMAMQVRREVGAIATAASNDPSVGVRQQRSCQQYVTTLVAVTRDGRAPTPGELEFVDEIGSRRAADAFPLEALLRGLQVAHRVLWERIVSETRGREGAADVLIWLTDRGLHYADTAGTVLTDAYQRTRTRLATETERGRAELVEELLSGRFVGRPDASAQAVALGFDPDAGYVVLVAAARLDGDGSVLRRERIKDALQRHVRRHASRSLIARRSSDVVAVIPSHARVHDLAAAAVADLASAGGPEISIGIGRPQRGLGELPRAYEEAFEALAAVRPHGGVAAAGELRLFDQLLARGDSAPTRLLQAPLIATLEASGGSPALADTLRAYLDCDLSVPRTAERLYVHPNTVRYRLAKLEDLTGLDTRRFWDLTEMATALELMHRAPSGQMLSRSAEMASRSAPVKSGASQNITAR